MGGATHRLCERERRTSYGKWFQIAKASTRWSVVEEVEMPDAIIPVERSNEQSIKEGALPSEDEITIDALYRLGVHPENNLMGMQSEHHETFTDQIGTAELRKEEDFVKLEEELYQERLEYCRTKKAPQASRELWDLNNILIRSSVC